MILDRLSHSPFSQLKSEMNHLWDSFLDGDRAVHRTAWPALNIWQDHKTIFAEAELPGMKMEDIEVLVSNNEVTINGERKLDSSDSASYHRRERHLGSFSRSITLPVEVNADAVRARLRDGILTVELPKSEAVLPKKIEVKCLGQ